MERSPFDPNADHLARMGVALAEAVREALDLMDRQETWPSKRRREVHQHIHALLDSAQGYAENVNNGRLRRERHGELSPTPVDTAGLTQADSGQNGCLTGSPATGTGL